MSDFVHLHLHSEYSLLDGAARINEIADRLIEIGQDSVALTDHGVMYGAVEFYTAMKNKGIKPIIGCEVYVTNNSRFDRVHSSLNDNEHLILLCKDNNGYRNLCKMLSLSFSEGYYGKNRVDFDLLDKYHEGLIALSGCISGAISKRVLNNNIEDAKNIAIKYEEIFGKGNYYIEIQNHNLDEDVVLIPKLLQISKETGIPAVATNDVHYLRREDFKTQKLLCSINTNTSINENSGISLPNSEFYLKDYSEMNDLFSNNTELLENTIIISNQCNVNFKFGENILPEFKIEGVTDNYKYFRDECYKGLYKKYGESPQKSVIDRLEYELSVINSMGYVDYYLVVNDFVSYARNNGIPVGPGRGSGAGSLAAYCIGITDIDPIKYSLLFERFLNPERVSMPDFDIDFCYIRRPEIIKYINSKYGQEKVAQIVTFGTMAARGAIRDVGRVLNIPYNKVDEIAKLVPQELKITIKSALEKSTELKNQYENNEEVRELLDLSMSIEGMPRHSSVHASGIVITKDPVDTYVPLSKCDDVLVTQYTMNDIAKLGLLKFDILGLRTLTVIDDTINSVPGFDINKIPLDDINVFNMFSKGLTEGVFQFESAGMKSMLLQLQPTCLEDIIAAVSLYRPGPMDYIPQYIKNKNNPYNIAYETPLLKPILDVTHGCIVYQEQVMQIFRDLAGYSYGRSDIVRRAMAKKNHEALKKEENNFIYGCNDLENNFVCDGAVKRGVDENFAKKLFADMMSFADYAYNKAHATSYAILSYRTAYLKFYYPAQFIASLLTSVCDNTNKISKYIAEALRLKIKIVAPDINKCFSNFTANGNTIVFGLIAVKGIGIKLIEQIVKERENNGLFTSFVDFCSRLHGNNLNRKSLESLIKCGALDGLGVNRRQMLLSYNQLLDLVESKERSNVLGQIDLFSSTTNNSIDFKYPEIEELELSKLLECEKEVTGVYFSGHPLEKYICLYNNNIVNKFSDIIELNKDNWHIKSICTIESVRTKLTKNNKNMAYVIVSDMFASIELVVFPDVYEKNPQMFREGKIIYLEGVVSVREDRDPQIICRSIENDNYIQTIQNKDIKENINSSKYSGLHILLDNEDSNLTKRVLAILSFYEGQTPVYIKFSEIGKRVLVPKSLYVNNNKDLINALIELIGRNNVKIIE